MKFSRTIIFTLAACFFLLVSNNILSAPAAEKQEKNAPQKATKTISNQLTPTVITGWCCVKGEVAAATKKECDAQGGLYGTDAAQVGKRCAMLGGGSGTRDEKRPPETQVVNNSGVAIFQVKVDDKIFSEHLGECFDGCSTGFMQVKAGSNQVSVKMTAIAPWQVVGSLSGFEYNKHYSVNMVSGKGGLCAALYFLADTSIPFNDNHSKRAVGAAVCGRFLTPIPVARP